MSRDTKVQTDNIAEVQRNLRRQKERLVSSGIGTIILLSWTILKAILLILFQEYNNTAGESIFPDLQTSLVTGILYGVFLIIQIYIGRSAINEGRGRKSGVFYIVLAIFMFLVGIANFLAQGFAMFIIQMFSLSMIVSLILELTIMVFFLEMIVSAFRVKRLRKRLQAADRNEVSAEEDISSDSDAAQEIMDMFD